MHYTPALAQKNEVSLMKVVVHSTFKLTWSCELLPLLGVSESESSLECAKQSKDLIHQQTLQVKVYLLPNFHKNHTICEYR